MSGGLAALTVASALLCGLVAGVLFAFSSFVMPALGRLPSDRAIAAMQSINVHAVTPAFMAAFVGAAVACAATAAWALADLGEAWAGWALAGGALYLAGAVGLTVAFHVPRNDALAAVPPDDPGAAAHWARYRAAWTAANHLRTVAALAAAAAFTVASRVA